RPRQRRRAGAPAAVGGGVELERAGGAHGRATLRARGAAILLERHTAVTGRHGESSLQMLSAARTAWPRGRPRSPAVFPRRGGSTSPTPGEWCTRGSTSCRSRNSRTAPRSAPRVRIRIARSSPPPSPCSSTWPHCARGRGARQTHCFYRPDKLSRSERSFTEV